LRIKLRDLIGDNVQLREFMLDRVKYYFRDVRGFKYDEVNAVLTPQARRSRRRGSALASHSAGAAQRRLRTGGSQLQANREYPYGRRSLRARRIDAGLLEPGSRARPA
jgi:hypothetical protein